MAKAPVQTVKQAKKSGAQDNRTLTLVSNIPILKLS